MKQFESRNILDRIETTWNMFFSSAWKVRVLPQILLTSIWTTFGILSCFPIFFLISRVTNWDGIDGTEQLFFIIKILVLSLVPVTIFTLVSGLISTYTLTVSHDYRAEKTWIDYARVAWSRLWWWAWYGLWMTLFILILVGLWSIFYVFLPEIAGFILFFLVLLFFWWFITLYIWAPWYILENSWNPRGFLLIFFMTTGRWWRAFGNIILGGVVVSSVLSLIQQFIYWIMGIYSFGAKLWALEKSDVIDWSALFSDFSAEYGMRFIFGLIILFILSWGQKVFIGIFQYIVWKDIQTEAPEVNQKDTE